MLCKVKEKLELLKHLFFCPALAIMLFSILLQIFIISAKASESKRQSNCSQNSEFATKRQRTGGESTISFYRIDGLDNVFIPYENDKLAGLQRDLQSQAKKDLIIGYGYSDPNTKPSVSYVTGIDLAVHVGMDLVRTLPLVCDLNDLYHQLERFVKAATLRLKRLPKDFASSVFADLQILCTKNVSVNIEIDVDRQRMMQQLPSIEKWNEILSQGDLVKVLEKDKSHVVLQTVFAFWTAFMQNAVRQHEQQCEAYHMFGVHRCYIGKRGLLWRIDAIWSEMRNNLADDLHLMHHISSSMQHHCANMVKTYNEVEEKIIDWSILSIVSRWTLTRSGAVGVLLFEREPSTNLLEALQRMGVVHLKCFFSTLF